MFELQNKIFPATHTVYIHNRKNTAVGNSFVGI